MSVRRLIHHITSNAKNADMCQGISILKEIWKKSGAILRNGKSYENANQTSIITGFHLLMKAIIVIISVILMNCIPGGDNGEPTALSWFSPDTTFYLSPPTFLPSGKLMASIARYGIDQYSFLSSKSAQTVRRTLYEDVRIVLIDTNGKVILEKGISKGANPAALWYEIKGVSDSCILIALGFQSLAIYNYINNSYQSRASSLYSLSHLPICILNSSQFLSYIGYYNNQGYVTTILRKFQFSTGSFDTLLIVRAKYWLGFGSNTDHSMAYLHDKSSVAKFDVNKKELSNFINLNISFNDLYSLGNNSLLTISESCLSIFDLDNNSYNLRNTFNIASSTYTISDYPMDSSGNKFVYIDSLKDIGYTIFMDRIIDNKHDSITIDSIRHQLKL